MGGGEEGRKGGEGEEGVQRRWIATEAECAIGLVTLAVATETALAVIGKSLGG